MIQVVLLVLLLALALGLGWLMTLPEEYPHERWADMLEGSLGDEEDDK